MLQNDYRVIRGDCARVIQDNSSWRFTWSAPARGVGNVIRYVVYWVHNEWGQYIKLHEMSLVSIIMSPKITPPPLAGPEHV